MQELWRIKMMRHKTHYKRILELQTAYEKAVEKQKQEFDRRINLEYDLAYSEIATKLRTLLVDVNYELFNSSDYFLRPKIYAFMANGLSMFHAKAYEGRPARPKKMMPEAPKIEVTEK